MIQYKFNHKHYKKVYSNVKKVDMRKNGYQIKITPQDRRDYYMMHDFYSRSSNFTLTTKPMVKYHSKKAGDDYSKEFDSYSIQKSYWLFGFKSILAEHDSFFFSDVFLKKLVDKFKKQIDYYQLTKIEPYDELVNKVSKFNSIAANKVAKYNEMNDYKCYDLNRNRRIHSGRRRKYRPSEEIKTPLISDVALKVNVATAGFEIC